MSFPKYPAYKSSGVEWLGAVPESWKVSGIKFFADLITGITPPSDDLDNYAEEGWPWVRPEDLNDSGKPVLASKFLTDQGWRFCRKVKRGSTLICCIGTIGKIGFVDSDVCTNQQITAVVPRGNGRFFFYAMRALKPAFDVSATGNVLRILNSERLGNVTMAVPDNSEAESIARFLDHETARIDALIEEQQRLIELLKEKRQAVISHAVTKGLDPTVPMKDTGVEWLGEVPAHWVCSELKRFASVQGGYAFPSDLFGDTGTAVIRIGDIRSEGTVSLVGCKRIEGDGADYSRFQVVRGDLLMAMTGATIGKAGWYDDDEPAYLNQRVGAFRSEASLVIDFMYYITQSSGYQEHIKLTAYGGAQPNISDTGMLSYFSAVPLIEEQMEICSYLNDVLKHLSSIVAETERSLCYLQERRSALISAAVTGKIDVRGWQPPTSIQAPELAVAEAN